MMAAHFVKSHFYRNEELRKSRNWYLRLDINKVVSNAIHEVRERQLKNEFYQCTFCSIAIAMILVIFIDFLSSKITILYCALDHMGSEGLDSKEQIPKAKKEDSVSPSTCIHGFESTKHGNY
jgi:hypothetical protein